ncbi:inactive tyrosine-protein kinase PRAG1 isoform X2 [Sarcophilus harrisii]|uniref:PEAK1 related, kinase-activating pseudokinase 1 n=2 Tax=Sarcophilus harrisii TaxID=9305 RepID=A0A7N4P5D9_SARHA|nr:inactive tyrosine-protein kinase PRAG1 isoform X2 [Sarcophilus harrisii]
MHQADPLTAGLPKMSACNEFVEHIWKPGSCKNCFGLQSDHQPQRSSSVVQPGAPSLALRPRKGPPEEEGCGPASCTKPTIAVKPTMMSTESAEARSGMEAGSEAPQVLWRPTPSKLPFPESRDSPRTFSSGGLSPQSLATSPRLALPSLARPGSKDSVPPDKGGLEEGASPPRQQSPPPAHQSFHQKLAAFLERAGGSTTPRSEVLPAASRDKDLQTSPSKDLDGGEYCSIASWCPPSSLTPAAGPGPRCGHGKAGPVPGGTNETASPHEEGRGPSLSSKEHGRQDPPENSCPFNLDQRKLPQALEAASLSDGLSSPPAGHTDSDYCSLSRPPELRRSHGPGPIGGSSSKPPGSPTQLPESSPPEPIYAEITKRKKPCPASSSLPSTNRRAGHSQDSAGGSWRPRPDGAPQVAAKVTIMATHTEDDQRTIYLRSPDSAVGVQWPCGHLGPGPEDASPRMPEPSPREQPLHNHLPGPRGGDPGRGCPAIPPKVCKGSPGESHGSPEGSPLAQLKDGFWSQLGVPDPTDTLSSTSSSSSSSTRELTRCLLPAQSSSWDQRRPRFQVGARNYQGRIEEEDGEGELDPPSPGRVRELERASCSQRPRAESISEQPSRTEGGTGPGMSKSASFAFEFPKDRSEAEKFSPPPPPPKSRHLLRMNKSSSDLEQASLGLAESLSPSGFSGIHVHFTTGSTDSLTSDSQTCSDGGLCCEPAPCPSPFPPAGSTGHPSEDGSPRGSLQPPPLPQKKTVSRAASSPDGLFLAQGSPGRCTTSPRLNPSHSETNICYPEESRFAGLGGRARGPEAQLQGSQGFSPSSSQLSVSSQTSACSGQQQPHSLLSSITSKEATYTKLSGLYAQSLVRLAARCERHFMGSQATEPHFNENSWSLFKLTCNKPCCDSGDAVYYGATCSEDPSRPYAVKICKMPVSKGASYCALSVPVHFNLQQDCGHFVASVPSSMLPSPEEPQDQDCVVVITREVPRQTAADFVRDSASRHWTEPEAYERRVCLLLLQLCQGLESLKEHGITHRALCLENLLLAPCPGASPGDQPLPRLIISNFLQARQQARGGTWGTDEQQRRTQARLAPEILAAAQYKKFDEFQTGILIYELLHQPNPFEERTQLQQQDYRAEDLPPLPALSLYSAGLQRLAHRLLEADPIKRLHIAEARRALQCLLWGPRHELLQGPLQNWLHMKRALLMMKLAEKALDDGAAVELEDWLCCQYLASAEPGALLQTLRLLQPL